MNSALPLAARMRPSQLEEFVGQKHILSPGQPLYQAVHGNGVHSMVLWGPPGSGKTTLAQLLALHNQAHFTTLSAVSAGVKQLRETIAEATQRLASDQQRTMVFIDEIHRFSKSQQDALLPAVEQGTIILVGATTENPSFELTGALLSRVRIYVLKPLNTDDLSGLIQRALTDKTRGFGEEAVEFSAELQQQIVLASDGDARRCLTLVELAVTLTVSENGRKIITPDTITAIIAHGSRRFDKGGEIFFDQISALHKAVRGSAPDAALYWLCRMLDGGCDPIYIARRVLRMASEDIGNADPRALQLALNAWDTYERLGSPEGELAIAQAVIYMACAAKSNAVYMAYQQAMADVRQHGSDEVPLHLRNAPTKLLKKLGYGKEYRYAHDEPHAYAAGEHYFPDTMQPRQYYRPTVRGLEQKIRDKLAFLQQLDQQSKEL